jgi:hypothetical protein
MNLRQDLIKVFNIISNNKEVMRLLYYPKNPLDESNADVETLPNFKEIRKTRIIRSPKSDDLTDENICRICMYMGRRRNGSNQKFASQEIILDVFAHIDTFDINDARSLWICDKINELLSNQPVTSGWKMSSENFAILSNVPKGYIGYRLIYEFVSEKF